MKYQNVDLSALQVEITVSSEAVREVRQRIAAEGNDRGAALDAALTRLDAALRALEAAEADLRQQRRCLGEQRSLLEEERAHYAALFYAAPDALLLTNADGSIRDANDAAAAFLGYRPEALIDRPLAALIDGAQRAAFRRQLRERLRHESAVRFEHDMRTHDGRVVPVELTVAPARDRTSDQRVALRWTLRDISRRRELEKQIAHVAAEERERIGRDLHDNLSLLSGASLTLRAVEQRLQHKSAEETMSVRRACAAIQQSIDDTRRLAHGLCNAVNFGGDARAAIEAATRLAEDCPGVRCDLHIDEIPPASNPAAVEHLYRITQEAVHNAVRHGRAHRVEIRVTRQPGELVLRIADDGRGLPDKPNSEGAGLRIMRQRACLLGGTFDLGPGQPTGVVAECRVPWNL